MTTQEILEAHRGADWNSLGWRQCGCGTEFTGPSPVKLHRAHVAEVLEQHMRERQAKAWDEGENAGYMLAKDELGDNATNPYKEQKK